jgi:uncharacterized protein with ParB-like and HNH nuclease domain
MAQRNANPIFDAEAVSLIDMYVSEGNMVGFRIPIYQRQYDWGKKNIKRLIEDVLSGLHWRTNDPNSLTFLGTIIALDEKNKEGSFDGRSFCVIDGQQRLSTFSILASLLYDEIEKNSKNLSDFQISNNVKNWIERESRFIKVRLLKLIYGSLQIDGVNEFPYPRIVREECDCRANSSRDSEYKSLISQFLFNFSLHVRNQVMDEDGSQKKDNSYFEFDFPDTTEGKAFEKNVQVIKDSIESIFDEASDDDSEDFSTNLPLLKDFEKTGFRNLFDKLPTEQSEANKILSYCKDSGDDILSILRLLTFSSFFMRGTIVTLVKVNDEKYGFDIFDSLNTTGEPLTAIQTFKPQVIRFESKGGKRYVGSESEGAIKSIEKYLESFSGSDKKQRAAKELVVSFALYKTGEKTSFSLDEQRRYLRTNFDKIAIIDEVRSKRLFVQNLDEMANYRKLFWTNGNLESQLPAYPDREQILLCLKFLKDLNNSLSIPILCRYYSASISENDKSIFSDAIKGLTAFVALRRGATGGTAGIDSDLRNMMLSGSRQKDKPSTPICVGLDNENPFVGTPTLKVYLKDWLTKKGIVDKNSWIEKVTSQALYSSSAPLCRFLLLAAAHNAKPDEEYPWKLVKKRQSREAEILSFGRWMSPEVATVEHIAPDSGPNAGWDSNIYSQPYLKHCLGNLTLLPQEENSAVANRSWQIKKKLYQAFVAESLEEVDHIIDEAKKEGFLFSKKNTEIIQQGIQLPLLKTIACVPNWSRDHIEKRSKNIAELAWDEISSWLFED